MHVFDATLEMRARGNRISGSFKYGKTATVADRGRRRKERIMAGAFRFSISEDLERDIWLLHGHSLNRPLAVRRAASSGLPSTLAIRETKTGVEFDARLPEPDERPSWMVDAVRAIEGGLARGVSPGFRVPPASVVPGALRVVPEPGNPDVEIVEVHAAVLRELSVVSAPVYKESDVTVRQEDLDRFTSRDFHVEPLLWL